MSRESVEGSDQLSEQASQRIKGFPKGLPKIIAAKLLSKYGGTPMLGLMTTKELGEYLSVSRDFIDDRRRNDEWKEGIHWIYLNSKYPRAGVRFIPELCIHWMLHQSKPKKHLAFIAEFQDQHKLSA